MLHWLQHLHSVGRGCGVWLTVQQCEQLLYLLPEGTEPDGNALKAGCCLWISVRSFILWKIWRAQTSLTDCYKPPHGTAASWEGEALDFTVIANEFSKRFIKVLVSKNVFLFMERDSHTALVNKISLYLGPERMSLRTAWLTSVRLLFQSWVDMFILLSGKRIASDSY